VSVLLLATLIYRLFARHAVSVADGFSE